MLIRAAEGDLNESKSELLNILPVFPKDFTEERLLADLHHISGVGPPKTQSEFTALL